MLLSQAYLNAQTNNALVFDGVDDYVQCNSLNPSIFTVMAWVKPNSASADQSIVSTLNTSTNTGFELHIGNNGVAGTMRNGAGWTDIVASSAITADEWVNLAVTFDGNTCNLFVNGILKASGKIVYSQGASNMVLGRRSSGGLFYNGTIDEVSVWDKVLSQAEMINGMHNGFEGTESNIVAYYQFNQGIAGGDNTSNTILADSTANANNGTITNFSLTGTGSNFITGYSYSDEIDTVFASESKIYMADTSGSKKTLVVSSNTNWTVRESCDWFDIDVASGKYNDTITVTTTANNTTGINRSSDFMLSATGANDVTITVIQTISVTATVPKGNGSSSNPYQIATIDNLYWLSKADTAWNKHFIQTDDIDASSTSAWDNGNGFSPIGNSFVSFTGTYNGKGHTISGLNINRASVNYVGLFGNLYNAVIDSVGLTNCSMTGNYWVGGLTGNIRNTTLNYCYASGNISGNSGVGGLIGYCYYSNTLYCYATGNVTGQNSTGGLIGQHNNSTIQHSYASCSVTGTNFIGGLVGDNEYCTISQSHATGKVLSSSYDAGGLIGYNYNSNIQYCHAKVDVISTSYDIGGLVGYNNRANIEYCNAMGSVTSSNQKVGGLVGENGYALIKCSYATGNVKGDIYVGGLTGYSNYDTIRYCYTSGSVSGNENIGGFGGVHVGSIVENAYATGSVTGNSKIGGFIGSVYYDTIMYGYATGKVVGINNTGGFTGYFGGASVCSGYYDKETSGQNSSYSATFNARGLTTAQMKDSANLANLGSFGTNWRIHKDSTYAALRGIDNNAPFAFRDTAKVGGKFNLKTLLANDFDYETLQKNLVLKVYSLYGAGSTDSYSWFSFPADSAYGYTDSLLYRVGEVRIVEGDTLWGNTAVAVLIKGENTAPTITSTAPNTVIDGAEYTYTVTTTDNEGDMLTYNISNQPSGMAITGNVITWIPSNGVTTSGEVTLTVSDGLLTDTETFTITVIHVYTITASAGDNGSIDPSGAISVTEGSDQHFTISANSGYQIADVLVNGSSVGAVSSYTFSSVSANHSIAASFSVSDGIDPNKESTVTIYPNPVSQWLHISNANGQRLVVYNLQGEQLIVVKLNGDNAVIDISTLKTGLYIVEVETTTGKSKQKLIKL